MRAFVQNTFRRLASVKSARGVSFTLAAVTMSSKPLGYLRMLITAWAFGTSPGMDAFHLASGIVALFAGSIGNAMQSAVMPELERVSREPDGAMCARDLVACIAWILIFLTGLLCAALAVAPGVLVRFFASGFDAERIRMGAVMLWWLVPYAVITMCRPLFEVWAMFTERYTLSALTSSLFNLIAIPALLLGVPLIGVYAVAFSTSAANVFCFALFFAAMRGVPLFWRWGRLRWDSLRNVGRNTVYVLIVASASTLFMVVDRYFASTLPSGSVAAISYAGTIFGILTQAANIPLFYFLSRMSKAVMEDPGEAHAMQGRALALMMAYFVPVSIFMPVCARPVVSLLYGWGNFDAAAVQTTAIPLAAYSLGLVWALMASAIARYAQACQRFGAIVLLTWLLVGANALFDWLLVGRWGLWGLAIATSVTQMISFWLYFFVMMRGSTLAFLWRTRFPHQILVAAAFAAMAAWFGRFGDVVQLFCALMLGAAYLLSAERLGLMRCAPEHWRPSRLFVFLWRGAQSYIGRGK